MLIGGLGGVVIAAANFVSLWRAISDGRTSLDLAWPLLALAFGVLLAAYFGYLAVVKAKLKRNRQ